MFLHTLPTTQNPLHNAHKETQHLCALHSTNKRTRHPTQSWRQFSSQTRSDQHKPTGNDSQRKILWGNNRTHEQHFVNQFFSLSPLREPMWTTPALSQKRNGSKLHMVMTTHFLLNGPLPSSANGDVAGITSTTTRWPCRRSEASDLKTTGTQNCGHRHMKLTTISLKRITQEKN